MLELFPQHKDRRLRVQELGDRFARISLPASDHNLRPGGTISGPTLMMLADAAMFMTLLAHIGRQAQAVTSSLNINFLSRPDPGDLTAHTRLVKIGRRTAVGHVDIFSGPDCGSDGGGPVAVATVTYALPAE